MRFAKIDKLEYTNGFGVGVSLYVQGCPFHCNGCFNPETWDFNGGKEWTKENEELLMQLLRNPQIKRVSILGGEPLANENVKDVFKLILRIKDNFGKKDVWLYTGFKVDDVFGDVEMENMRSQQIRKGALLLADYVVDGRFEKDKKDMSLAFKGSSNQRVLNKGEIQKIFIERSEND